MDWKQQAEKLIAKANLIEAIELIEANGVKTGDALQSALYLESESQQHVRNKTQFARDEYEKHSEKSSEIAWLLLQKINGTDNQLPEYLK